jgi:hypothetical protein
MRFVLGVQGNVKRIFNSGQQVSDIRVKAKAPGLVSGGEGTTHNVVVLGL